MPSVATHAANQRFVRKLGRAFNKLATPCQFISHSGKPPFDRGVNLQQAQRDDSSEYVVEAVKLAEFLKADGSVNCDDRFELAGQQYVLTQLYETDEITVSFVYIEF
ncbi:hypothetical protein L2755_04720 [Shewanella abyssi]|uniref:hypothetical protein n=1 Tax=Shewanella abyssi TaxID=311789 RepID=UPI00200F73AB|nr:hypothetical protein [Shewanella abyssi]MCL1048933.1 hypothetical protein [Shewanella abyssi]